MLQNNAAFNPPVGAYRRVCVVRIRLCGTGERSFPTMRFSCRDIKPRRPRPGDHCPVNRDASGSDRLYDTAGEGHRAGEPFASGYTILVIELHYHCYLVTDHYLPVISYCSRTYMRRTLTLFPQHIPGTSSDYDSNQLQPCNYQRSTSICRSRIIFTILFALCARANRKLHTFRPRAFFAHI